MERRRALPTREEEKSVVNADRLSRRKIHNTEILEMEQK